MTMTLDAGNQQRFGHFGYDSMSPYHQTPQFTNPWPASNGTPSSHGLYASAPSSLGSNSLSMDRHSQQQPPARSAPSSTPSLAPYGTVPVTSAPASANNLSLLSISRATHPASSSAYQDSTYTSATSPVHSAYPTAPSTYEHCGYAPAPARQTYALASEADSARRFSQSSGVEDRRSFQDALEASHGMMSMKFDTSNQETPRAGIYNSRSARGSQDSYGFPTHSSSSSISSSTFSPYYGSVDSSVSDYSSVTGSDAESVSSRTLPRPQGLMGVAPPAASSMMTQFSSKVSSSAQKKHRCKVCDKRFTRPSSLQTHMYSHTGEKPFQCEVEGCGRHFSVVSNLRRHRKVHKGDAHSETSEDHSD